MPGRGGKGTTWTPELERHMLILAITTADLKPSMATWNLVSQAMGNGITASAVSQKFAKLKKATENGNDSPTASTASSIATPQTTPTQPKKKTVPAPSGSKRKAATTVDDASDAQKRKKRREIKKEQASDDDHGGDFLGHVRDDGVDLEKQNDRTVNEEQTETPA